MPWTPEDALRFTKKAITPKLQRQWADVANSALERGLTESEAIREANSVIRKQVQEAALRF